jgi:alkaline phosphatase D
MKAYHEWLPMRRTPYDSYSIGDLATLFRVETRLLARDQPLSLDEAFASSDPRAALAAFRAGPLADPKRTLMGTDQERWLADGLATSTRSGTRWQLLAQQVVMAPLALPQTADRWFSSGTIRTAKDMARLDAAKAAARAGLPLGLDSWGGYPAARERLLASAAAAGADLVTLTGDSHNAWAFDLEHGGRPVGVEFAGQSVASVGFEARFTGDPSLIAADMISTNRALKWCDTSRRGYFTLDLSRSAATAEWVLLDTATRPTLAVAGTHLMVAERGARRLSVA